MACGSWAGGLETFSGFFAFFGPFSVFCKQQQLHPASQFRRDFGMYRIHTGI